MFFAFPVFSGHGRECVCACMIQFQCRAVVVLVVLLVNVESVLQLQIDTFLRLCVSFCYYRAATYLYLIVTLQRCWWCQKIESYLGTRHAKALRRSVLAWANRKRHRNDLMHVFISHTLPFPTLPNLPHTTDNIGHVQQCTIDNIKPVLTRRVERVLLTCFTFKVHAFVVRAYILRTPSCRVYSLV